MPYTHTTFGQLKAALAARLQDPANVFWLDAELGVYIIEALRTWNAMAAWYRDRMVFNTTSALPFYDLSSVPGTLIPYSVTDRDLFQTIEYHLLEPVTNGTWSGSEQFNAADVTGALQRRRDQFLLETGCRINHSTQTGGQTPTGRVDLADIVIDVRRLVYLDANGAYTKLWPDDEYIMNAFASGWSVNPGPPSVFSVIATPPVRIQIAPIPNISGTLDLLTIDSGAALDPTVGVAMGVPDDFTWAIKFGALLDLLTKDGPPSDPIRASYCQKRWDEGLMLAKLTTSVLFAAIDGTPVHVESAFDLDTNRPGWQGNTITTPSIAALAGMNMLVLADTPDSAPHAVTLDVLRNMVVPAVNSDQILVGREELDAILDYSEHLAAFKMSGAEFAATMPAYGRMVNLAMGQNARWRAFAKAAGDDHNRARRDFSQARRGERPEAVPLSANMEGGI